MNEFVFLRKGKEYIRVSFSDIIFVESLKNYVRIITSKESHIILVTMNHVEEVLPKNLFCRIHRSYIVALKFITAFNHDKVRIPGNCLSISEPYRKTLLDRVLTLDAEPKTKKTDFNEDSAKINDDLGFQIS